MHHNIFDSWSTSSRVWNVGKGSQSRKIKDYAGQRHPKRRVASFWMFTLFALGVCATLLVYPDSSISATQKQTELPTQPITPFDLTEVIEKAEHLIQKDASHPDRYWAEDPAYRVEADNEGVTYYQKKNGRLSNQHRLQFRLGSIKASEQVVLSSPLSSPLGIEENKFIYQRTPLIKELYEVRRDGVEQSWLVDQALSDKPHDLIIEGRLLTSLLSRSNRDGGIDFVDRGGNYVTTYGKVIVIDNAGRRLTISPLYNENSLTITVPAKWLAKAEYPVLVDPLIGSNIQVDSLATSDNYPAIAFDGTNYLIVWQAGTPNAAGTGSTAIKGVRVSNSGTVLDITPLDIGDTVNQDDEFPSVAYDSLNSRFIVVWMKWNDATDADIWRNTVNTSGLVGTSTSIIASNKLWAYPSVACCDVNDNYYVVYGRGGGGPSSDKIISFQGQTYNRNTHAAATGSNPAATVNSGSLTPDTEPRSAPRLYSLSDTQYLMVWETFDLDTNGDVSANIVTVDILPSYTWGTGVAVAATSGTLDRYPRAAFDGANAFIVYQQGALTSADIYGRFVTPGASLTLGTVYPVSIAAEEQTLPDITYTTGTCSATAINRYLVVWQDYRNNGANPDIYGAPVDTTGIIEAEVAISSNTTYGKLWPVVTSDEGSCGSIVAWSDDRNSVTTSSDIYAQLVGYPIIDNLSPVSGNVGDSISINGLNFGADPGAGSRSTADNNITINGAQVPDADVTFWSNTVININIPTGTPTGTYPVIVTAGNWITNSRDLTVTQGVLQITTSTLADGWQWIDYATNLQATGGTLPYSWSLESGTFPPGLTLYSSGLISGNPSGFGTFNFTVKVTDSSGPAQTDTMALSITIYELQTIAVTPADPTITQGQTIQFTATGTYSDLSDIDMTNMVNWSSSDINVATVDSSGLATGIGLGAINISAQK